jgi:hypothetical protein
MHALAYNTSQSGLLISPFADSAQYRKKESRGNSIQNHVSSQGLGKVASKAEGLNIVVAAGALNIDRYHRLIDLP